MVPDPRRARDLQLLDRVDAYSKERYAGPAWRVVREGRDPLLGGRSVSRWCNGEFDVLYTSLERDGAIAEVHALLALQPVFPSKISFQCHKLSMSIERMLHLVDLTSLEALGVNTDRYQDRDYGRTQEIADAAYFLGFDGLLIPNARWSCTNAVLFTDRIDLADLTADEASTTTINWQEWRRENLLRGLR